MAHSSYGRSNVSSSVNSDLRREMSLRRQLEASNNDDEELPSFSEPRRITVERQDSITTSIKNVLGDIHMVSRNIEHQPNIWLGTSRASSSNNKSAETKTQREGSNKLSQQNRHSKSQHSNLQQHSNSSMFSPRDPEPNRVESPNVNSNEVKRLNNKYHNSAQHYNNSYSSNQHHKPVERENDVSNFEYHNSSNLQNEDDKSVATRDRLQSVDMPNAVEHIFQEMQLLDRLTDIQTPNVVGKEFNFHHKNNENYKVQEQESNTQALKDNLEEQPMSESDSSEDESEEESEESEVEKEEKEEKEEETNKWSLDILMKDYQNDHNVTPPAGGGSKKTKNPKDEDSRNEQSSQSTKRLHTRGRQSEKLQQNKRTNSPNLFQDKIKKEKEEKRESIERSRSNSRPRHGSSNKSSSPKPISSRHQSNINPKKSKDSPLVRNNEQHLEKRQKHNSSPGLEKMHSKLKENTKSNFHPPKTDNLVENRFSASANNNSNNPSNLEPPCTVKTISKKNPSTRHHVGRKDPANMKYRIAEKQTKIKPTSPMSSDSESDSPDKNSSGSSSESEEEVEVRTSPPRLENRVNVSRERSSSTSSAKTKHRKPVEKSRTPEITQIKTNDRRSAPGILNQIKFDQNKSESSHHKKHRNQDNSDDVNVKTHEPKLKPRPNVESNAMEVDHVKKHKSTTITDSKPKKTSHRKSNKPSHKTSIPETPNFPSLWVHLQTVSQNTVTDSTYQKQLSPLSYSQTSRVDFPMKNVAKLENIKSPKSTGSETEQPKIRTANIQMADAVSSSDIPTSQMLPKRKQTNQTSSNPKSKRIKRETPSPTLHEQLNHSNQNNENLNQSRDDNNQWKDRRSLPTNNNLYNNQQYLHPNSNQQSRQNNENNRNSLPSTSIVSEPDSSWPEKEKLLKSDQYMREGKRLKHEGDGYTDARTGRTRPGEALSRALVYFEAALCFVMNGFMLEMENGNDRNDSSSSSNAGVGSSPTSMYHQTISLMDYIRKMRPHDDQEGTAFKRLNLSCIRCQALLYLRVYLLKKDAAAKYSELISEQFKQYASKSNRTPSPWHNVNGQNVSPMSPAVPSPYGSTLPGPSPIGIPGSNYEPVSSSTQPVGKMTSPPSQSNVVLPPKMYEIFKHYHTIMNSVMLSHEKWDQAELLLPEHADFFRNVDTLCGHVITLHSSLRDMVTYNKAVLRQLRADYVTSPRE